MRVTGVEAKRMADRAEIENVEQAGFGVSQEELARLDAQDLWVEVEDGVIHAGENNVPPVHVIIIRTLFRLLDPYVTANQMGEVFMDGIRYILASNEQGVQRAYIPDLSFLRRGLIPAEFDWTQDIAGAPTLAVEVASPGQTNPTLLRKVSRYLEAGSEEVWLLYPKTATLYQYRPTADEPNRYHGDALVDTSLLFPGLTFTAVQVFALPDKI
jgi:Uma2 family endonuclease